SRRVRLSFARRWELSTRLLALREAHGVGCGRSLDVVAAGGVGAIRGALGLAGAVVAGAGAGETRAGLDLVARVLAGVSTACQRRQGEHDSESSGDERSHLHGSP